MVILFVTLVFILSFSGYLVKIQNQPYGQAAIWDQVVKFSSISQALLIRTAYYTCIGYLTVLLTKVYLHKNLLSLINTRLGPFLILLYPSAVNYFFK